MSFLSSLITKVSAETTNGVNLLVPLTGNCNPNNGPCPPNTQTVSDLNAYLGQIFPLLVKLGILVAIIAIAYYGLGTIVSNIPGFKNEAKTRMQNALLGLGLLLVAYLILQTINPDIFETRFDPQKGIVTTPAKTSTK